MLYIPMHHQTGLVLCWLAWKLSVSLGWGDEKHEGVGMLSRRPANLVGGHPLFLRDSSAPVEDNGLMHIIPHTWHLYHWNTQIQCRSPLHRQIRHSLTSNPSVHVRRGRLACRRAEHARYARLSVIINPEPRRANGPLNPTSR
ncbi:hypothetical protein F5Y19DRAFT_241970 [Xylariaceae sp. FL1651]|nr:hypothetical protein F5Y19DRAFT_241970 [Xylariaceae sp. FL1651]